jgi:hypothetical protein
MRAILTYTHLNNHTHKGVDEQIRHGVGQKKLAKNKKTKYNISGG